MLEAVGGDRVRDLYGARQELGPRSEFVENPEVACEEMWQQRRIRFLASQTGLRARIRLPPARRAELAGRSNGIMSETRDGGWLIVEAEFRDLPHAEYTVWTLASMAGALDPPELRDAIRVRAQRLADAHRTTASPAPAAR